MAATSRLSVGSLIAKIISDYPDINFVSGEDFSWSFDRRTITHPKITTQDHIKQLLHELGHAELNHKSYSRDVELVDMERQAWGQACKLLAPKYGIDLSTEEDTVQESLDSYRQWLHDRSCCPSCQAIGVETLRLQYRCLNCQKRWRVNEARLCRLKRMSTKNSPQE